MQQLLDLIISFLFERIGGRGCELYEKGSDGWRVSVAVCQLHLFFKKEEQLRHNVITLGQDTAVFSTEKLI
jgi:hypothetical protein